MDILIKGLNMPKDGEMLCIDIHPDGKVSYNLDLKCKQIATAASIPPHGRLIDADALPWYHKMYIVNAPTIIEAEGE